MPSKGKTSERGYGARHQRIARALRANLKPGTECRRCGQPMYAWQQLDAGHSDDAKASERGDPDALEHASCNRGAPSAARRAAAGRSPLPEW